MRNLFLTRNILWAVVPALLWTAACGGDDDDNGNSTGGTAGNGGTNAAGENADNTSGKSGSSTGGSSNTAGTAGTNSTAGKGGTESTPGGAGGEPTVTTTAGQGNTEAGAGGEGGSGPSVLTGTLDDIDNVVFIYAENRSFDSLFGTFPGAHGLSEVLDANGAPTNAYIAQKDRDGTTPLSKLPKTWKGVTLAGNPTTVTEAETDGLTNKPFAIENAFIANGGAQLTLFDVTRDLTHRFFENIMEINGGTNDMFGAWLDAGGLTMGYWDYSGSGLSKLAHDYVLADNFFEGAYGGSFLNHQYLICACAPKVDADWMTAHTGQVTPGANASVNVLGDANGKGVPQLVTNDGSPVSALDGAASFKTGAFAPIDYFGVADGWRAVNTMQPPYQPSGNTPDVGSLDTRFASTVPGSTLPPQTETTIGDLLSAKSVTWAWYATSWDAATADGTQDSTKARTVIYTPSGPRSAPDFQPHHQPFNYYADFDPATHAADRAAHLKDYNAMLTDIKNGTLPSVTYYKPTGNLNQHPGYANAQDADEHISQLVARLQAGPQWNHMLIVITYDEYGGQWDHVAPPKGDKIGPGTRIPAIIISPYAKKGTIDHTQYDTASITRFITKRFNTNALAGITARDTALLANGKPKMGDLTAALNVQ